jgi:hypothetical protein
MIEQLRVEIEQLKRRSGPAPFSKGMRKPDPKPPGRKPSQGFFRFRNAPEEMADAETVDVPVAVPCCLDCRGALGERKRVDHRHPCPAAAGNPPLCGGRRDCSGCSRKVRGQHADIVSGPCGSQPSLGRVALLEIADRSMVPRTFSSTKFKSRSWCIVISRTEELRSRLHQHT